MGVKTHNVNKKDVALIVSDVPCAAAGMFTKNVVKAAPVRVTMEHLADGRARAVIANSGNANACAPQGEENARRMCAAAAKAIGCGPEEVLVASTGVIGQTLKVDVIEAGVPELAGLLARSDEASDGAAHAIMTTDTVKKEVAVRTEIGGKAVTIGGIAKGSGMIHPNMGTMLCFLTTDCAISPEMLRAALHEVVRVSFNRISVDGDTSTNDTCCILANGLAGNGEIREKGDDYAAFVRAEQAETISKSVISSTLTKAAIFGCDANWGRVLCAMGYSGENFNPEKVDVRFRSSAGEILVCEQGRGLAFDEGLAKTILTEDEVEILIQMGEGDGSCTCWGCDITYDYIKINGDLRAGSRWNGWTLTPMPSANTATGRSPTATSCWAGSGRRSSTPAWAWGTSGRWWSA